MSRKYRPATEMYGREWNVIIDSETGGSITIDDDQLALLFAQETRDRLSVLSDIHAELKKLNELLAAPSVNADFMREYIRSYAGMLLKQTMDNSPHA